MRGATARRRPRARVWVPLVLLLIAALVVIGLSLSAEGPRADQRGAEASAAQAVDVLAITDGDTIDTTAGKVRLIGIDTPERGEVGFADAGAELGAFLSAGPVTLVAVTGNDDTDRYGRLLRYVRVDGRDAGAHMLQTGWATARYDSRDGYDGHPLEAEYIALDAAHAMPTAPTPAAEPVEPPPGEGVGDGTDPRFDSCREANAHGYGEYEATVDAEYDWYRDGDGDGWACER
ncbi:thermonuclease family protein [Microbacterium jiangjiandongii]|uniref:thermonuclease family protein n=1 Tax=Microbacterium jiangjiandongii TaxID=3049071 RepID=UPI00214C8BB1|nr:thermonuclease family protein [Microbacterium sp. zg.Y843]MCR2814297.1 thermonuclease family protein [Microbacterium sp. zg.Y843]